MHSGLQGKPKENSKKTIGKPQPLEISRKARWSLLSAGGGATKTVTAKIKSTKSQITWPKCTTNRLCEILRNLTRRLFNLQKPHNKLRDKLKKYVGVFYILRHNLPKRCLRTLYFTFIYLIFFIIVLRFTETLPPPI